MGPFCLQLVDVVSNGASLEGTFRQKSTWYQNLVVSLHRQSVLVTPLRTCVQEEHGAAGMRSEHH